jgi:hypothetical protein
VNGPRLGRRLVAEALGTGLLVACVVGSGIMAAKLAGDQVALALLCNTLPTGAILVVLITILGPVSGAHFNPAVSAALALRRELPPGELVAYVLAQIAGGLVLQLRLHEREPSAPVVGLSDGLVRPSPEGPVQDEGRRRRAAAGCQAGDQAADLGDAERHQELAGGSRAPFSLFRPARSPASRASASMARVTCRCQPRQLLTS